MRALAFVIGYLAIGTGIAAFARRRNERLWKTSRLRPQDRLDDFETGIIAAGWPIALVFYTIVGLGALASGGHRDN